MKSKNVLKLMVTTSVPSILHAGRALQFIFEVEADSVAEVHERLAHDRCLFGMKVTLRDGVDGRRVVNDRWPTVISIAGIAFLQGYRFTSFETDEVPANA